MSVTLFAILRNTYPLLLLFFLRNLFASSHLRPLDFPLTFHTFYILHYYPTSHLRNFTIHYSLINYTTQIKCDKRVTAYLIYLYNFNLCLSLFFAFWQYTYPIFNFFIFYLFKSRIPNQKSRLSKAKQDFQLFPLCLFNSLIFRLTSHLFSNHESRNTLLKRRLLGTG